GRGREGLDPAALGGDDCSHHRLLVDVQPADVLANDLQLTLPPSRTRSDVGRTVLFEESLQRAPASRHGNNSRSLSVRQPMLPHELVAPVSARATSAPDHQEANLGPTGTSPTASPRTSRGRPARDFHARKVPGRAFCSPDIPTPRSRLRGDPGVAGEG